MRNPITWLITDTHWNTDFKQWRPTDYGQLIVKNCRKVMAPQDVLIHLGDVINNRQGELSDYLEGIPANTKILIRGNHDHQTDIWYMGKGFNFVCDQMIIGDVLLSHIPQIIPNGIRINIHGHFHDNPIEKCWLHEPHLKEIYCEQHKLLAMEHVNYCPVQLREMWWDTLAVPSGETTNETKEN
jgi:calcineurin-like phosphoesterase family protein